MKLACAVPSNAIISVSGGLDSTVAFHYLHNKYGINRIFHFNHNYQPANAAMETAVRELAKDFGASIIVAQAKDALKTEAEFREARLAAAFPIGCEFRTLVTGHHLNDSVESHFLNVIRGKENHLPMPISTQFPNNNKIIHPFILIPKEKLQKYALTHGLDRYIVCDPSNDKTKGSRRNFIRNVIIPLFEKEQIGMAKIVKKKLLAHIQNAK